MGLGGRLFGPLYGERNGKLPWLTTVAWAWTLYQGRAASYSAQAVAGCSAAAGCSCGGGSGGGFFLPAGSGGGCKIMFSGWLTTTPGMAGGGAVPGPGTSGGGWPKGAAQTSRTAAAMGRELRERKRERCPAAFPFWRIRALRREGNSKAVGGAQGQLARV